MKEEFDYEGDQCHHCNEGVFKLTLDGDCVCFQCAPCHACTNAYIACDNCGSRPLEGVK